MKYIQTIHDIGEKQKSAGRVLSQPNYDVVHIHMKANEEITEHHAKEETLIVVRTGKVIFDVEGEKVELTNEDVLQMDPFEKHGLRAVEETDLLLLKFKLN